MTTTSHFASCIAFLALTLTTTISFSSCSGTGELEEMLSAETTPVTFRIEAYDNPVFFDYTEGWRYIGSDTVKNDQSKASAQVLNLHQGKHNIVAAKGIDKNTNDKATGIRFDPDRRVFYLHSVHDGYQALFEGEESPYLGVPHEAAYYWHRQLEVSPYLLPEQQPQYQPVTATLQIVITDPNNRDIMPGQDFQWAGSITDVPVVEEVGIESDKSYKLREQPHEFFVGFSRHGIYGNYPIITYQYITLCPLEGLNNITLPCIVTDEHGQVVPTTPLPKFSLRRGHTTILSGPLYSGTASDWTVEMKPYIQ